MISTKEVYWIIVTWMIKILNFANYVCVKKEGKEISSVLAEDIF